jgi:type II secretory pathway component HofQ
MKAYLVLGLAAVLSVAHAADEPKKQNLTVEEQAFAGKLGETTRQAFTLMSSELRQSVLALMKNPGVTADAAVEQVMKNHPNSSIKVDVKTK